MSMEKNLHMQGTIDYDNPLKSFSQNISSKKTSFVEITNISMNKLSDDIFEQVRLDQFAIVGIPRCFRDAKLFLITSLTKTKFLNLYNQAKLDKIEHTFFSIFLGFPLYILLPETVDPLHVGIYYIELSKKSSPTSKIFKSMVINWELVDPLYHYYRYYYIKQQKLNFETESLDFYLNNWLLFENNWIFFNSLRALHPITNLNQKHVETKIEVKQKDSSDTEDRDKNWFQKQITTIKKWALNNHYQYSSEQKKINELSRNDLKPYNYVCYKKIFVETTYKETTNKFQHLPDFFLDDEPPNKINEFTDASSCYKTNSSKSISDFSKSSTDYNLLNVKLPFEKSIVTSPSNLFSEETPDLRTKTLNIMRFELIEEFKKSISNNHLHYLQSINVLDKLTYTYRNTGLIDKKIHKCKDLKMFTLDVYLFLLNKFTGLTFETNQKLKDLTFPVRMISNRTRTDTEPDYNMISPAIRNTKKRLRRHKGKNNNENVSFRNPRFYYSDSVNSLMSLKRQPIPLEPPSYKFDNLYTLSDIYSKKMGSINDKILVLWDLLNN